MDLDGIALFVIRVFIVGVVGLFYWLWWRVPDNLRHNGVSNDDEEADEISYSSDKETGAEKKSHACALRKDHLDDAHVFLTVALDICHFEKDEVKVDAHNGEAHSKSELCVDVE